MPTFTPYSALAAAVCSALVTYTLTVYIQAPCQAMPATSSLQGAAQHQQQQHVWHLQRDNPNNGVAQQRRVQANALRNDQVKHVTLPGRWPLPDIPMALYHPENGSCVLSPKVCSNFAPFVINEDVHVRDIIASCLMKCMFKPGSCRTADLGGNMGLMTTTMLALGANVTTVEPQIDLCSVINRTAALNGWSSRLKVLCGAVGIEQGKTSMQVQMEYTYRIGGPTRKDIVTVPLYNMPVILEPGHYDFIKIDTDSIDCAILGQLVGMIQTGRWSVDSLILETWDAMCKNGYLAGLLEQFQHMNYTVYRTLLWERHFPSNGSLPTPLAVNQLPPYATEVFDARFARWVCSMWLLAYLKQARWPMQ